MLKKIGLIFLLINSSFTYAVTQSFVVPFENIILDPNVSMQASYSFGDFPIIFCYENNFQEVGIVTWPFSGAMYSATLLLSLITNGNYQGSFADPVGTITITNNQNYQLVVSCLYGL